MGQSAENLFYAVRMCFIKKENFYTLVATILKRVIALSSKISLEEKLNVFDPAERRAALQELVRKYSSTLPTVLDNVNMHFHSFFSYNSKWHSPSRIAWESRKKGLYAAALCDFDVLDGQEEFLDAGLVLSLRTTVHIETRAYIREYADVDINSPGENGIVYIMGGGFARQFPDDSEQARGLLSFRQKACERNRELVERINAYIPDIAVDYDRDVIPLTPAGSPTERHIVRAYLNRSREAFGGDAQFAQYWSGILKKDKSTIRLLFEDLPSFEEQVRAKLVKRGGLGYKKPSIYTFPLVDDFLKWVASCDAVPMAAWLDGTSEGEKDPGQFLEYMREKGAAALNIIPDRNWNLSDPEERRVKQENLRRIIEIADGIGFPINIGTEMNKLGLPFVDNLDVDALRPYREVFLRGARIMIGHTLLLRYAGYSYIGEAAGTDFPEVSEKNDFFEAAGGLPPLDSDMAKRLQDMGEGKALLWLKRRAQAEY